MTDPQAYEYEPYPRDATPPPQPAPTLPTRTRTGPVSVIIAIILGLILLGLLLPLLLATPTTATKPNPAASNPTVSSPPPVQNQLTITAQVGIPCAYTLDTTAGEAAVFAVTDGELPEGLTLNPATGVISGTPTFTGDYPITITSSQPAGPTTQNLTIKVVNHF